MQSESRLMRPRLLDLFCGAGGCAVGYHRAGFDIVGVDHKSQPRFPFPFIQADALEYLAAHGREFDAIHASPPCQGYSLASNNGSGKAVAKLIPATRTALLATGKPWVIENVPGAPLFFPLILCGASFGLGASGYDLPRHRHFETSHLMLGPPCHHRRGRTIGVYGNGTNSYHRQKMGRCLLDQEKATAMGIDWMTRKELTQAIPPAYTEFVGRQLIEVILCRTRHD